ncbi:hypothetical protein [Saccharopolyspora spinosa]|uniref:hypothetical protein n=1 Tax=Saccharopolyspora spinosa TaxID=60894 RepID=UPI00117A4B43|nr:hypothetical protein [Saccharopolyspora spinosa]
MLAHDVRAEYVVDLLPHAFGDLVRCAAELLDDLAEDLDHLADLRRHVADRLDQLLDDVADLRGDLGDLGGHLRDDDRGAQPEGAHRFQCIRDDRRDALGHQIAHELAHERDDLAHDRHDGAQGARQLAGARKSLGLLRGMLAIRVARRAGPLRRIGLDRVVVLLDGRFDRLGHFPPRLPVSLDAVRVAGEPVQRLLEGLDVLDQPRQAVGEQGTDRVHGHADDFHRHAAVGQAGFHPAGAVFQALDVVGGLQDPDALDAVGSLVRVLLQGVFGDDQVVFGHHCTLLISALLSSSTAW